MKRLGFLVSGRVQGVFYRENTIKKAKELGLVGFVRNLSNGKVEVLAEGGEKKINRLAVFCKSNPGYSRVKDIEIIEEKEIRAPKFNTFKIIY